MLYISREVARKLPDRALQILPLLPKSEQRLFEDIYLKLQPNIRTKRQTPRLILQHITKDKKACYLIGKQESWKI